jgi:putative hydroxymethylpyrimidine transport system ATP-binding protein
MRQRVALARTLMEDTPVVLLDEPFSALDTKTRHEMQELAFKLLHNKTVLLVTHDAAEAIRLSQTLLVMTEDGLTAHDIDAGEPLRQITDARFVASQSRLLTRLNQAGSADA